MSRFREEVYAKAKTKARKAPSRRSAVARADLDRARKVRAEFFAKPLQERQAIHRAARAQAPQARLM